VTLLCCVNLLLYKPDLLLYDLSVPLFLDIAFFLPLSVATGSSVKSSVDDEWLTGVDKRTCDSDMP